MGGLGSMLQNKVYTVGDVSKICLTSARTVSRWIDEGDLKGWRLPRSRDRRTTRHSLIDFLKANKMEEVLDNLLCLESVACVGLNAEDLEAVMRWFENRRNVREVRNLFELGKMVGGADKMPKRVVMDLGRIGRVDGMEAMDELVRANVTVMLLHPEDTAVGEATDREGMVRNLKQPVDRMVMCRTVEMMVDERAYVE